MDKEIENPKTGNKIKIKTALQLPDEHPANKKAKDMVAKSPTKDDDEPMDATPAPKGKSKKPMKNPFSKESPAYEPKQKEIDKEKEQHKAFVKKVGKTPQPADFDGDMDKYFDALNQHMKDVEAKLEKEKTNESTRRKYTIKEVRMWMKKLEENRYKKVYNSDARRVAWMVNNEGRTLDEMPISMKKKWTKAQYGRERYLATEFLKSKSEQLSEGLDLKKLETAIKDFQNKIKKQGRVTNARDEDHLKQLIKVYKQMGGKKIKEGKLTEASKKWSVKVRDIGYVLVDAGGASEAKRLVAKKLRGGIKDILGVTKALPSKKVSDVGEEKLREQIREIIKEQLNEQKLMKILLNKKDMSKLQKAMKKYPFKSLPKFKQKGSDIELNVPKKEYNKAVEFLMKNKLNPRG